jgi:hypothetical protein
VRPESAARLDAGTTKALRGDRHVVHEGVRHVAIDVLPRAVVTFRTVCGRDVVSDEHEPTEASRCSWCFRVERTWVLVKEDLGD